MTTTPRKRPQNRYGEKPLIAYIQSDLFTDLKLHVATEGSTIKSVVSRALTQYLKNKGDES